DRGSLHAGELEHRRQHVDRVGELVPDLPARRETTGPAHHAGIGDAALVDLALPTLERRVAGHRPAPRVVVVSGRTAQLADAGLQLVAARGHRVPEADVVDGTEHATLRAGP